MFLTQAFKPRQRAFGAWRANAVAAGRAAAFALARAVRARPLELKHAAMAAALALLGPRSTSVDFAFRLWKRRAFTHEGARILALALVANADAALYRRRRVGRRATGGATRAASF